MHLRHAHQLRSILAEALFHQGQTRTIAEHVTGSPQQRQQPAANIGSGRHQQQLVASHAVQDHFRGAQDARADADKAHTAALAKLLEHGQLFAEIIEVHGNGSHAVFLGQLLDGLKEVAAGHHGAVAGTLQHAL